MKSVHESQGLGNLVATWQKFFQMKKLDDISVQTHIAAIREVTDRLTGLGDKPSEALMVAVPMLSLPESYGALIISLDSHMDRINFDFVTQHCMNEEACQHSLNGMPNHGEMALAICAKDRSKVKCFNCGILGHYKNECWKEKKKEQEGTQESAHYAF